MKVLITICWCAYFSDLMGQQFAGPEQTVCKSYTAVTLGIPNPNPEHCYEWLKNVHHDDKFQSNPIVFPAETTTYDVVVTDQNFSFVTYDKVKVKVEIGRIAVLGEPIQPNIEEPYGQAFTQLVDSEITAVNWSIADDPDNTGCEIRNEDESRGEVFNCAEPGTIVIRATDANDPECYSEKEVLVNHGIIELSVEEVDNGARIAYSGETLYVVGPSDIRFIAFPNPIYMLPSDQPEWGGDLLPEEEHPLEWVIAVETEGTYVVTCSDFEVTVIVLSDEVVEIEVPTDLSLWIKYKDAIQSLIPFLPDVCGESPQITINVNNILTAMVENMEKSMSPDYYEHVSVIAEIDNNEYVIKSEGCAILSEYSKIYTIPGMGFFELSPSLLANVPQSNAIFNQIYIETMDASEEFDVFSLNLFGDIELLVIPVIDFNEVDVFVSPAFTEISSTFRSELRLNEKKIEYKTNRGGLQMNPKGYLYTGMPSNPMWKAPVNMSFNIMDGHQSGWKTFADLSSLFD